MQFHLDKDHLQVACSTCDWKGTLGKTDDMDVTDNNLKVIASTCVCPRCGHEVREAEIKKGA